MLNQLSLLKTLHPLSWSVAMMIGPDIAEGITSVYLRFREVGVPAELHIYTGVGHGFGIRARNHTPSSTLADRFGEWLADRGFLGKIP